MHSRCCNLLQSFETMKRNLLLATTVPAVCRGAGGILHSLPAHGCPVFREKSFLIWPSIKTGIKLVHGRTSIPSRPARQRRTGILMLVNLSNVAPELHAKSAED